MRIYKNKTFSKWVGKEGVSDGALETAVEEMVKGLVDANLGGQVYKSAWRSHPAGLQGR